MEFGWDAESPETEDHHRSDATPVHFHLRTDVSSIARWHQQQTPEGRLYRIARDFSLLIKLPLDGRSSKRLKVCCTAQLNAENTKAVQCACAMTDCPDLGEGAILLSKGCR